MVKSIWAFKVLQYACHFSSYCMYFKRRRRKERRMGVRAAERDGWRITVLICYCWVTNYHKLSSSKPNNLLSHLLWIRNMSRTYLGPLHCVLPHWKLEIKASAGAGSSALAQGLSQALLAEFSFWWLQNRGPVLAGECPTGHRSQLVEDALRS